MVASCATLASVFLEGTGLIHSAALVDEYGRPIPQTVEVFCTEDNCVFGWMAKKWAEKILLFGLLVGVVCIAGFNYAMQYLPPLVFSSISLLDPALTAIISWIAGVESLPTLYSWFGGATVMLGVAIISIGEHRHEDGDSHGPTVDMDSVGNAIDVSLHDGAKTISDDMEEVKGELELMQSSQFHQKIAAVNQAYDPAPPPRHVFSVVSEDDDDNDHDGMDDENMRKTAQSSSPKLTKPISLNSMSTPQNIKTTPNSSANPSLEFSSLQERYRRLQDADDQSKSLVNKKTDGFEEEKPQPNATRAVI